MLATAWIAVSGSNDRRDIVHALLDQGSVTMLISERLEQRLQLKRTRISISVTGISGAASVAKHAVQIDVSPRNMSGPVLSVTALILKSFTMYVPQRVESLAELEYLRPLKLADSDPTSSDPIDIIIGADLYGSILWCVQACVRDHLRSPSLKTLSSGGFFLGRCQRDNHLTPFRYRRIIARYTQILTIN